MDLASNAILTVLSFFTVTTACWIKTSSLTVSTLRMWPCFKSLSNSASTASCNCSGIRLPFCWVIVASFLNQHFMISSFICPCRLNKIGNFVFNRSLLFFNRSTHYFHLPLQLVSRPLISLFLRF